MMFLIIVTIGAKALRKYFFHKFNILAHFSEKEKNSALEKIKEAENKKNLKAHLESRGKGTGSKFNAEDETDDSKQGSD